MTVISLIRNGARTRFNSPYATDYGKNALPSSKETLKQKCLRWLDLGGGLTRYQDRREWLLHYDPVNRVELMYYSELERKLEAFREFMKFFYVPLVAWAYFYEISELETRPLVAQRLDVTRSHNKAKNWPHSTHRKYAKCTHCRWADAECWKECLDEIRAAGHNVYGYSQIRHTSFEHGFFLPTIASGPFFPF